MPKDHFDYLAQGLKCIVCGKGEYVRYKIKRIEKLMDVALWFKGSFSDFDKFKPAIFICSYCGNLQFFTGKRGIPESNIDMDLSE